MIEIARFADVYEAEIAASRLRADGYEPVLGGAEHVKANPLVLMALGGVSLSVPDDQAAAARVLLEQLRGGADRIADSTPALAAPTRKAWPLAILAAVAIGILIAISGQGHPQPTSSWEHLW
ncbi:hypothetical protein [Brevundimonas lenta]|uniref:DUF2007 domain-containing protein n=2 Tax=Brevundimonas lenta TaxID=424796 RepID=A0A7W6NR60_9CAUL|nr:hypothetical protein [Brevundimonas lenta]